jgi:hypothetical protein
MSTSRRRSFLPQGTRPIPNSCIITVIPSEYGESLCHSKCILLRCTCTDAWCEVSTSQLLCTSYRLLTGWVKGDGWSWLWQHRWNNSAGSIRTLVCFLAATRTTNRRQAGNIGSCVMNNIQQPLSWTVTIKRPPPLPSNICWLLYSDRGKYVANGEP